MDKQVPFICGERIYLRPMEPEDLDIYREAGNDARLGKTAGFPFPRTKAGYQQWYDKTMSESYGKDGFYFSACRLEDEAVVGFAWLWQLDHWNGQGEFTIFLSKVDYLNQGYGTEIARIILDFGFNTFGLQRIYLYCSAEDPRAQRCYEKAGYVVEGRMRKVQRRNGYLADFLIMSVLREEWEARKA